MAFDAKGVGMLPSTTGTGGIMTYSSSEDDKATIGAAGYWTTDLSSQANAQHLRARTAMEDFVAAQAVDPTNANRGSPIYILASDGAQVRRAVLVSGRITISAGI